MMRERILRTFLWCAGAALVAFGNATITVAQDTSPVESPPSETTNGNSATVDSLHSLEWLLGEWTAMTDNAVVLVSAHWCDGGAFIEREIIVRPTDQPEIGGTQRIGWDPIKKAIKSWNFDSLGGTGEGYWRRDGDSWIIEGNEVLADGQTSTTTSKLTPKGADRIVWEVERANVEGETLPKLTIEFVRANEE
jgi:hypothetical protein